MSDYVWSKLDVGLSVHSGIHVHGSAERNLDNIMTRNAIAMYNLQYPITFE